MIREMTAQDVDAAVGIAIDVKMFPAEAIDFLRAHAHGWLEAGKQPGTWVVDEVDGTVLGVAFYEPRDATDRVWYLTLIAVSPRAHGQGRGAALMHFVESELRKADQRLLLIETSATPAYDKTRAFYAKLGYTEVARVPDYYEDGDDMVLFRKDLRS